MYEEAFFGGKFLWSRHWTSNPGPTFEVRRYIIEEKTVLVWYRIHRKFHDIYRKRSKNFGSVLVQFTVVKILYFGYMFIILNLAKWDEQGFESGSVSICINLSCWIRIRISTVNCNFDLEIFFFSCIFFSIFGHQNPDPELDTDLDPDLDPQLEKCWIRIHIKSMRNWNSGCKYLLQIKQMHWYTLEDWAWIGYGSTNFLLICMKVNQHKVDVAVLRQALARALPPS